MTYQWFQEVRDRRPYGFKVIHAFPELIPVSHKRGTARQSWRWNVSVWPITGDLLSDRGARTGERAFERHEDGTLANRTYLRQVAESLAQVLLQTSSCRRDDILVYAIA